VGVKVVWVVADGRMGRNMTTTWFKKWWVIAILVVVVALYGALVVYRIFAIGAEEKTAEAVERIHGMALTMADVTGENLPPRPGAAEAVATIAGVDANENGIRDDVEHAIFDKYPDDIKIRAAMLQYAMALQMEFTEVVNSETLVAVIQEQSRGSLCISNMNKKNEIIDFVLNTETRQQHVEEVRNRYMTSYSLPTEKECDLEL